MSLAPPIKPVYLKACGITTAAGLTTEQTAVAVRSGISAYQDSPIINKSFDPMTMALIPEDLVPPLSDVLIKEVPELTSRQTRMLRLAHLALSDLQSKHEKLDGLPLFLAGPETLPNMPEACHSDMLAQLAEQAGIIFHEDYSRLVSLGRAGGLSALYFAMAYVEAGIGDCAIVGGVDTYLDLYLLASLDQQDRILAAGVMDGFAPGEGAGFLLITSQAEPFQDGDTPIMIYPPGFSMEKGHRFSEEPYRGDGLAEAFTNAFAHAPSSPVKSILASLNGENHGAKELSVAIIRNSDKMDPDFRTEHPAECLGDLGAAFVAISIGLSAMGLVKDYIDGPVLNYASSEEQYRAAAIIST